MRTAHPSTGDVICVGDYVRIGDQNELTWQVAAIDSSPNATAFGPLFTLISGQSGRRRYETQDKLTIFKKGNQQ